MLISERYCNIFKSLFSDWPKAYSEFSKSAPGTSRALKVTGNNIMYDRCS